MEKTKFIVQLYAIRCVPGIYTSLDFCVWAWKICCLLEGSRNESVVAVVYLQCKKNWSKGKQMLVELLLRRRNSRKRFRFSILRFVVHTFKYLPGNPTIGNSALGGGTTLLRFVVLSTTMMFWRLTSSIRYVSSIVIISNDTTYESPFVNSRTHVQWWCKVDLFRFKVFGGQVSKDPDKNHFVWQWVYFQHNMP